MSQLFLSAGGFPWVILKVGAAVKVEGEHRVLTSAGPAGAADILHIWLM